MHAAAVMTNGDLEKTPSRSAIRRALTWFFFGFSLVLGWLILSSGTASAESIETEPTPLLQDVVEDAADLTLATTPTNELQEPNGDQPAADSSQSADNAPSSTDELAKIGENATVVPGTGDGQPPTESEPVSGVPDGSIDANADVPLDPQATDGGSSVEGVVADSAVAVSELSHELLSTVETVVDTVDPADIAEVTVDSAEPEASAVSEQADDVDARSQQPESEGDVASAVAADDVNVDDAAGTVDHVLAKAGLDADLTAPVTTVIDAVVPAAGGVVQSVGHVTTSVVAAAANLDLDDPVSAVSSVIEPLVAGTVDLVGVVVDTVTTVTPQLAADVLNVVDQTVSPVLDLSGLGPVLSDVVGSTVFPPPVAIDVADIAESPSVVALADEGGDPADALADLPASVTVTPSVRETAAEHEAVEALEVSVDSVDDPNTRTTSLGLSDGPSVLESAAQPGDDGWPSLAFPSGSHVMPSGHDNQFNGVLDAAAHSGAAASTRVDVRNHGAASSPAAEPGSTPD
ncbi:hypothetical protein [Cumulibacter soli]|uniref:hypothetical protein n=1 Tax=Cumulibacter soli TaxID=2546344 RepID=UPI0010679E0B|nr:hypothetical protein [Cumulibacter soli]